MIEARLELDHNSLIKSLEVKGHSGHSRKGSDIVCSAVSILAYSTLLSIQKLPGIDYNFQDKDDIFFISIAGYLKNEIQGMLRGITLFLIQGLQAIENKHNNCLKLTILENKE